MLSGFKRFWVLISVGLLLYVSVLFVRNIMRYANFEQELTVLEHEHERLEFLQAGYKATQAVLDSPQWWVLEAKKKMGYSQPREVVYKFYE